MKRINKIIELLERDQPVYYDSTSDFTYENGVRMASTWADYIRLDLEHGPFDLGGIDRFMQGLVAGGPTAGGHRTPAIVAELPFQGSSREVVESNVWIATQLLARGVHGLLLCHAESPEAVRALVEGIRYPLQPVDERLGLAIGRRGHGGEKGAAAVWGVTPKEYMRRADPWPLNPEGELVIGVKMENRRAAEHCEETARVPGLCFGEWGLGDMSLSFGYAEKPDFPLPAELEAVRLRIWNACRDAGLRFLGIVTPQNVTELIDRGMRICRAYDLKAVEIGKRHTGRDD
ncbi:HpcH/HpaI aldolase family protein [Endothiovibrio diazotrophicus]